MADAVIVISDGSDDDSAAAASPASSASRSRGKRRRLAPAPGECRYDGFCTRNNPAHFAKWSHPRQRRDRAIAGMGASAASAASASSAAGATKDGMRIVDLTEDSDDGGGGGGGGGGGARSRGLLRPTAGLTCPICLCDEEPGACVELRGCGHGFCEDCITQHVRLKVADGEVLPAALQVTVL